jgi:hypothetical protein
MDKVKIKCAFCGEEKEVNPKPEPKTAKEKKEIYFRCKCGGANLRDGTAIWLKKMPPSADNDPPGPAKPKVKDNSLGPDEPVKKSFGPFFLLAVLLGVTSFAAFAFLGRRRLKTEVRSSESPQDPFEVIH